MQFECNNLNGKIDTMPTKISPIQKDQFWQIIRGICILAVMLIHCPSGIAYGAGTFEFTTHLVIRQVINFPVAIFIFLSGYFVNSDKCIANPVGYIFRRVKRLVVPFLLWSVFYTGINIARNLSNGQEIDGVNILLKILVGKASTPLYYIVVLMQLTLLTPILIRLIRKSSRGSLLLYGLTPLWILGLYLYNLVNGALPMLYETFFPAWFCFYYLGLRIKADPACVRRVKTAQRYFGNPIAVLTALGIAIAEAFLLLGLGCSNDLITSQIKFGTFLYTFMLILWVRQIHAKATRNAEKLGFLKRLGDDSYGIYYIHWFFLIFIQKLFDILGISKMWLLHYILTWILLVGISFSVVHFVSHIFAKNKFGLQLLSWIGFR